MYKLSSYNMVYKKTARSENTNGQSCK